MRVVQFNIEVLIWKLMEQPKGKCGYFVVCRIYGSWTLFYIGFHQRLHGKRRLCKCQMWFVFCGSSSILGRCCHFLPKIYSSLSFFGLLRSYFDALPSANTPNSVIDFA